MPEFSTPFSGNKCDRKLSKEELIRTIRFSIASEFEAIQLYEQIKDSIDNIEAKKIFEEVSEDEKIHVGNFTYLLELLSPEDKKLSQEGRQEALEVIQEE